MRDKEVALASLIEQGQRTLKYLNTRETAFASLVQRKSRAVRLLERQKEARVFLARQPLGVWAQTDLRETTQEWLSARAQKALAHLIFRAKTFASLQVFRFFLLFVADKYKLCMLVVLCQYIQFSYRSWFVIFCLLFFVVLQLC
jgi:hypothetical protein